MPDHKKSKKNNKKDSQLVIRIRTEDRDKFVALCDELDTSAAREIRAFIKSFLRKHEANDDPQPEGRTAKKEKKDG